MATLFFLSVLVAAGGASNVNQHDGVAHSSTHRRVHAPGSGCSAVLPACLPATRLNRALFEYALQNLPGLAACYKCLSGCRSACIDKLVAQLCNIVSSKHVAETIAAAVLVLDPGCFIFPSYSRLLTNSLVRYCLLQRDLQEVRETLAELPPMAIAFLVCKAADKYVTYVIFPTARTSSNVPMKYYFRI